CVDRLIRQPGFVGGADHDGGFEIGVFQALLSDGNQVGRNIHGNDASAALQQWDNIFPGATAEVEYGLAPNVSHQVKCILEAVRCIGGRIQVAVNLSSIEGLQNHLRG